SFSRTLPALHSFPTRRSSDLHLASEYLDALFDLGDRPDVKLAGSDGFQNILAQHQIFHVGLRHHHALRAGEALDAADVKEAFDLDRKSTRLNSSHLVISYAVF